MSTRKTRILLLVLATLAATAAGCRPNDKAFVKGRITLAGEPLDNVLVMFVPAAGPSSGGTTDADGRYGLTSGPKLGKQVFTGRCKVSVGEIADDPTKPPPPPRFDPRYLSAESSGLDCDLKTGPNTVDFDLDPNPAAGKAK
ncbi:MAG: hypothetical protein ACKOWG_11135 [Planctomycetia bacterium]